MAGRSFSIKLMSVENWLLRLVSILFSVLFLAFFSIRFALFFSISFGFKTLLRCSHSFMFIYRLNVFVSLWQYPWCVLCQQTFQVKYGVCFGYFFPNQHNGYHIITLFFSLLGPCSGLPIRWLEYKYIKDLNQFDWLKNWHTIVRMNRIVS